MHEYNEKGTRESWATEKSLPFFCSRQYRPNSRSVGTKEVDACALITVAGRLVNNAAGGGITKQNAGQSIIYWMHARRIGAKGMKRKHEAGLFSSYWTKNPADVYRLGEKRLSTMFDDPPTEETLSR